MIGTAPGRRAGIITGLTHAASAGASAVAALTVSGHNTIAGITIGVTGIVATAIAAMAGEWFWLRAVRQPARNLDRVTQITSGSLAETERLMNLLTTAENNVLTARAACNAQERRPADKQPNPAS
jgi:hypothetical protein